MWAPWALADPGGPPGLRLACAGAVPFDATGEGAVTLGLSLLVPSGFLASSFPWVVCGMGSVGRKKPPVPSRLSSAMSSALTLLGVESGSFLANMGPGFTGVLERLLVCGVLEGSVFGLRPCATGCWGVGARWLGVGARWLGVGSRWLGVGSLWLGAGSR